ncbi:hypothetical protein V6U90_16790 [Micromonospora sp. CPCC 206060]|uniref:hypothetical protein n=1 Tax=Micromonospora sp. CPCC 206060 TaxID=3122406 RepID=UPI002FF0E05D
MSRPGLAAALLVVRCASALLPDPDLRARHREEWQADVHGAHELGLNPLHIAFGTCGAAVRIAIVSRRESPTMLPIGPLALALHVIHGQRPRRRVLALAAASTVALLGGVALLLAG